MATALKKGASSFGDFMSKGKQVIIDMSETIKGSSGRDMEQWLFRIVVLGLLAQCGFDIQVMP